MPCNSTTLTVLNPCGEMIGVTPSPPSPRLNDLSGKTIAIIENRIPVGEIFFPLLEKALQERVPAAKFHTWELPLFQDADKVYERLSKIAAESDGVVFAMGISGGSTTRTTPYAVKMEKIGRPTVLIVTKCFKSNARFIAKSEGLTDLAVAPLIMDYVPPAEDIKRLKVAEKVADEVVIGLTRWYPQPPEIKEVLDRNLEFTGADYFETTQNFEKFFLSHGWSDGLPLVPPTTSAVMKMLEGTDFPKEHLITSFPPGNGGATVEKIAINAVMAGCLPQYLPVILAAVDAVIDPKFDLMGVQCTSGQLAPLLLVSGQRIVQELNINDSFCTLGPGWRANSTIGRALKLIMMNIGRTWPGINDMKAFGNPFRYVTLIAENEQACAGAWEPFRVAEGFAYDQSTLSVMPAMSWQPDLVLPTPPTVDRIVEHISIQAKAKYDRYASNCVYNNLVLISPTAFDAIRREEFSRADLQKALYRAIQLPGTLVFDGREGFGFRQLPKSIIERHKADPESPVPLLLNPESLKICVTGGPGPDMISYIGTWGYGPSYFITKPINLPNNWQYLLDKYDGWKSPTIK